MVTVAISGNQWHSVATAYTIFDASSADVVFLRNAMEFLRAALSPGVNAQPPPHLLFHTDGFQASSNQTSGLEHITFWRQHGAAEFNTGLFLMRPSCLQLAEAWVKAVASDAAFANWMNDQQGLNKLLLRGVRGGGGGSGGVGGGDGGDGGLLRVFDGSLWLGVLPSHLWPSGHVFFIQALTKLTEHALHSLNLVYH